MILIFHQERGFRPQPNKPVRQAIHRIAGASLSAVSRRWGNAFGGNNFEFCSGSMKRMTFAHYTLTLDIPQVYNANTSVQFQNVAKPPSVFLINQQCPRAVGGGAKERDADDRPEHLAKISRIVSRASLYSSASAMVVMVVVFARLAAETIISDVRSVGEGYAPFDRELTR